MSNHRKVYLEITNSCNLSCSFCPGTERERKTMTEEEFNILLSRIKGYGEYLYYHLMGEPTAHPLLPRFIESATAQGLKSIITTNGTLLPKKGDAIIAARPHKVSISLHAFEANTLSEPFEAYVSGCVDFAKKASVAGIIVVLRLWNLDGRSSGAMNERNDQILSALRDAFPNQWKAHRSGYKLCDGVFLEWGEKFDWPKLCGEILSEEGFCYGLRDQIGVLCDGRVVPCCLDRNGDLTLGNLFDLSLEEILSSPRAKAIYDGFTEHKCVEDLCKRCMRASYYR